MADTKRISDGQTERHTGGYG